MNQYQLQQKFMLQAQQKSLLSAVNDLEGRHLGMVLNEQITGSSNDGKLLWSSDVVPTEGPGLQERYPLLDSGDGEVLTKVSFIYSFTTFIIFILNVCISCIIEFILTGNQYLAANAAQQ